MVRFILLEEMTIIYLISELPGRINQRSSQIVNDPQSLASKELDRVLNVDFSHQHLAKLPQLS
jgi:hypothetical protein